MISLGCAKNLVNSEQMLYLMSEAGFTLVPDPDGADLVIVNTCGFIDAAKSEAIDNILEMAELKKAGRLGGIIVTGCLSERYKDTILSELPEIDAVLGISNFKDIVFAANAVMERRACSLFSDPLFRPERAGGRDPPRRDHRAGLGVSPDRRGLQQLLRLLRHPLHPGPLPLT